MEKASRSLRHVRCLRAILLMVVFSCTGAHGDDDSNESSGIKITFTTDGQPYVNKCSREGEGILVEKIYLRAESCHKTASPINANGIGSRIAKEIMQRCNGQQACTYTPISVGVIFRCVDDPILADEMVVEIVCLPTSSALESVMDVGLKLKQNPQINIDYEHEDLYLIFRGEENRLSNIQCKVYKRENAIVVDVRVLYFDSKQDCDQDYVHIASGSSSEEEKTFKYCNSNFTETFGPMPSKVFRSEPRYHLTIDISMNGIGFSWIKLSGLKGSRLYCKDVSNARSTILKTPSPYNVESTTATDGTSGEGVDPNRSQEGSHQDHLISHPHEEILKVALIIMSLVAFVAICAVIALCLKFVCRWQPSQRTNRQRSQQPLEDAMDQYAYVESNDSPTKSPTPAPLLPGFKPAAYGFSTQGKAMLNVNGVDAVSGNDDTATYSVIPNDEYERIGAKAGKTNPGRPPGERIGEENAAKLAKEVEAMPGTQGKIEYAEPIPLSQRKNKTGEETSGHGARADAGNDTSPMADMFGKKGALPEGVYSTTSQSKTRDGVCGPAYHTVASINSEYSHLQSPWDETNNTKVIDNVYDG